MAWGDEGFALLYESWYKTRRSKVWMIAPAQRGEEKQILFDRDYEDAYSDPGSPALRRTHRSTYVIARLEGTGQLIMQGLPCVNLVNRVNVTADGAALAVLSSRTASVVQSVTICALLCLSEIRCGCHERHADALAWHFPYKRRSTLDHRQT